ncbi:hypothetical protein [Achromobacter spanius]|uniref:Uncharacterized protein n=1 Tax=Achromobacter spanius TaxID=217203 RepID=A0AA42S7R4_9BURK|nr:hypothetical protein [Achromobacter spanius]MDH0739793.1 hypothetical protein [Achromobacter spanius]
MTDRELLELAAWAAGIKAGWVDTPYEQCFKVPYQSADGLTGGWKVWNPLEDDGDALRLAVKLRLHISQQLSYVSVSQPHGAAATRGVSWSGQYNDEPYTATRRPIVHAAAEIGKTRSD